MALTAGYTRVCTTGSRASGIQTLYLVSASEVSTATLNTGSTEYSAFTLATGKRFWSFEFEQDQAEYRQTVTPNRFADPKVLHEIEIFADDISVILRTELALILTNHPCGYVAVVVDNNGVKWVVGYSQSFTSTRSMHVKDMKWATAKALGEVPGTSIIFESTDKDLSLSFTGTVDVTV